VVWAYLATQAEVIVHYLRLVFVPAPLAFLYDWPLVSSLSLVAWQAALLGALVLLTVVAAARRHPAAFLGAWFFLVLAPSSSVLPIVTEVAAEHRMYLPLAAVIAAVITGLFVAGRTLRLAPKPAAIASALALALVAGSLGMATRERNRVYWSAEGLWQDAVNARPSDSRPRVAHGEALAAEGRLAEAETELLVGVALAPEDPAARVRLGAVLARQRKFDAAVPHLERALARRPDDVDAHRWLAEVYAVQRRDRLAVDHYERALAVLSDDGPLLVGLATILADSRDALVRNPPRAKELAGRAARLSGGRDPRVLEVLAAAQAASGQFAEAAATARTAAGLARARGDRALVSALEYRAAAYESRSRQFPATGR
jgi:tetratricopeptide (TPR) repeat protein